MGDEKRPPDRVIGVGVVVDRTGRLVGAGPVIERHVTQEERRDLEADARRRASQDRREQAERDRN